MKRGKKAILELPHPSIIIRLALPFFGANLSMNGFNSAYVLNQSKDAPVSSLLRKPCVNMECRRRPGCEKKANYFAYRSSLAMTRSALSTRGEKNATGPDAPVCLLAITGVALWEQKWIRTWSNRKTCRCRRRTSGRRSIDGNGGLGEWRRRCDFGWCLMELCGR